MKKIAAALLGACATAALSASLAAPASADFPGRHPAYLHAMGDLRDARALIDQADFRPGVDGQEDAALDDIRSAYGEIAHAGYDDGKNIHERLIDPGIDHRGRLHRALQALQDARRDVARAEDDPAAIGLRDRALRNIEGAEWHVRNAIWFNRR